MSQISATAPHHRWRSVRSMVVVAATIAAFTILAPAASASARHQTTFHLAKQCDAFPTCVVTASNDKDIPAGTTITYADTGVFPTALVPTINAKHGSATGLCDLSAVIAGTGPGTCVFKGGTGSLRHFRIELAVTFDGTLWYWDGTFHHRHHHHRGHHH